MKVLFISLFVLLFSTPLLAGEGSWTKRIKLTELSSADEYSIEDRAHLNMDAMYQEHYKGFVFLDYSRYLQSDLQIIGDWNLHVDYVINNGTEIHHLIINHGVGENIYSDYNEVEIPFGERGFSVKIRSVWGEYKLTNNSAWINIAYPQSSTQIPDDIDLRLEVRSTRCFDFDIATNTVDKMLLRLENQSFRANWSFVQGAEQYDLEWVFIDALSQEYQTLHGTNGVFSSNSAIASGGYELPFTLQEPTRVRLWGTNYTIDNVFPEGVVYLRVRALSKFEDGLGNMTNQLKTGDWFYFNTLNINTIHSNDVVYQQIDVTKAFSTEKNWSYNIVFSEQGKSISTLTYFDGSSRSRQSHTHNTSDNITLIAETKADYEGRQCVSLIPAPVKGKLWNYQVNFNLDSDGLIFDEEDFDGSTSTNGLSTTSGSAQYFSPNNNFNNDLFRATIPDANGYVYSQTVFRNDGSGRIESIGDIGEEFSVNSEHAIKTMYGTPNPFELKRLFGNNVAGGSGIEGYRKETVSDENGQLSVKYFNKRGQVIATGLAGNNPVNLIGLDDEELEPLDVTDILLQPSTIQAVPTQIVTDYTFMNPLSNNSVKLKYDLTSTYLAINSQSIFLDGNSVNIGDICQSCKYKLTIIIKDQHGNHLTGSPYTQLIAPTLDCTIPGATSILETVEFDFVFEHIQEYRITKTLELDQESLLASFEESLSDPTILNTTSFISNYVSSIDYSDCYSTCDEYCAYNSKYLYEQVNGYNSWNTLDLSTQQALIAACIEEGCDQSEINEDPSGDDGNGTTPIINPFEVACSSFMDHMIQQVSPGGIYYSTGSLLWQTIEQQVFTDGVSFVSITVDGVAVDYTLAQLQDEALFNSAVAEYLVQYHREYCHSGYCSDWANSTNFNASIIPLILETTWVESASILSSPYLNDPFLTTDFNLNGQLETAINNYLTDHISDISNLSCTPIIETGNLFQYVNELSICLENTNITNNIVLPVSFYDAMKKQTFIGIYGNIKEILIKDYKASLDPQCLYFYDDNRVYFGPMTQSEMQTNINMDVAEMLGSIDCEQVAISNVANWLNGLPAECLTLLQQNNSYNPAYTTADLVSNVNSMNIEQLFYNYTNETCATNTFGWFFNPDPQNDPAILPGELTYNVIHVLIDGTCGTGVLSFEVTNPGTVNVSATDQTIPGCINSFLTMMGVEMASLNSIPNNSPLFFSCSPNQCLEYNFPINSTTFPELAVCGITGSAIFHEIILDELVNSEYVKRFTYEFGFSLSSCDIKIKIPIKLKSRPVSFYNPVKHAIYYVGSQPYFNVISFDVLLENGEIVSGYIEQNSCIDFGSFSNQSITDFGDFNFTFDFQNDCITNNFQQGIIDAQTIINDAKEEARNLFMEQALECMNSATEKLTISYKMKEYQYTLYYYDLVGNLVQTVPPQGVDILTQDQVDGLTSSSTLPNHSLETHYFYNGLNVLIGQYTPDGGTSTFILDKLYRVRFSQNARQKVENKASYSKYDELGRVYEAGEVEKVKAVIPPFTTQDDFLNLYSVIEDYSFPSSMERLDYTESFYESVYPNDLTINTIEAQFTAGQQNLRNAIGAIAHHQIVNDATKTYTTSVISYSYDSHKNIKELVNTNYQLASLGIQHKKVEYEYELISNNVNKIHYQKGNSDEYNHKYNYDANNRLIRVFTSKNEDNWEMDAKYFYYLHGALARSEIGHDKVQGIDYAYNLKGWIKGVNSSTLDLTMDIGKDGLVTTDNKFFGVDAYGFNLNYFDYDLQTEDGNDVDTEPDIVRHKDYASIENITAFSETRPLVNINNSLYSGQKFGSLFNGNITHMVTAIRKTDETILDVLGNNYRYDQLQRIKGMDVYSSLSNNSFVGITPHTGGTGAYEESYSFDDNGNIKTLKRNGSGIGNNLEMDNFVYNYATSITDLTSVIDPVNSNRLISLTDDVSTTNYLTDIDGGQLENNYQYDASGQLIKDLDEDIEKIEWTVTGKIKKIKFTILSGKEDLQFIYDPKDNRIAKMIFHNATHSDITYTYYSYDEQGNVLATYTRTTKQKDEAHPLPIVLGKRYVDDYILNDFSIQGSCRLGVENQNLILSNRVFFANTSIPYNLETNITANGILVQFENPGLGIGIPSLQYAIYDFTNRIVGDKNYELKNHLGNVLAVITDRKKSLDETGTKYSADVIQYTDYSPFGVELDERHGAEDDRYRYGFQGQQGDDEIKGEGNSMNYQYRMVDPRVGRFFTVDPLENKYPWYTPYQFSGNKVISCVELEGLEEENCTTSSNGQSSAQGAVIEETVVGGTAQDNVGMTYTYKSKYEMYRKYSSYIMATSTVSFGVIQNGILKAGVYTRSQISYNVNLGKSFTVGVSIEPRINLGYFSKQSNISSGIWLFIGKNNHFQFGMSNDFFTDLFLSGGKGTAGFNGQFNKWTATDGGLTMHFDIGLWNHNYTRGLLFQAYGYTPHRYPFDNKIDQYSVPKGEGGMLYNDGLFNTPSYDGDYRTYNYFSYFYIDRQRGFSFGLSAGVQLDIMRIYAQGSIHHYLVGGIGEFSGWNKAVNPLLQFTFTRSIDHKRSLKQISQRLRSSPGNIVW